VFLFKVVGDAHSLIIGNEPRGTTCIDASRLTESYVTGSDNGEVLVWEPEVIQGELRQFIRRRFNVGNSAITCIAASQYSSRIVAVGNSTGYVRIIDLRYGDDSDLFDAEEGVEYIRRLCGRDCFRQGLRMSCLIRVESICWLSVEMATRL
jgi:hypothetical protein